MRLRTLLAATALLGVLAAAACADTQTETLGQTADATAERGDTKPRRAEKPAAAVPARDPATGKAGGQLSGSGTAAAGVPSAAAGTPTPPAGTAGTAPAADDELRPQANSSGAPARRPAERGDLPLDGSLSAACAERGDTLTVTVRTRPNASIAGVVEYVDEQAHGAMTVGNADGSGRFVWRFVVTPDAPLGDATAWISAQDRSPGPDEYSGSTNGEQAAGEYPFEVRDKC